MNPGARKMPYEDFLPVELTESADKPLLLLVHNVPVAVVLPWAWYRQLTKDAS